MFQKIPIIFFRCTQNTFYNKPHLWLPPLKFCHVYLCLNTSCDHLSIVSQSLKFCSLSVVFYSGSAIRNVMQESVAPGTPCFLIPSFHIKQACLHQQQFLHLFLFQLVVVVSGHSLSVCFHILFVMNQSCKAITSVPLLCLSSNSLKQFCVHEVILLVCFQHV